jgi:hypothetical protein
MYAIDRGQLDFPILILTTSSFLLLFKSNQTKVEFSLGVSFFSIAVALKIFPILVLPLFIFYFRGLKLYVILFTNLAIVLHGFLNGWIYVIQNLVEPTLQGSGFLNLFKLTSGDYSQSLLSSKTETIFKIVTLCLLIYMGAKLRTTILNPPGLLIALHFIMWSVGINHLYKNIFLVTGIMLLLGKVRMNNLHNHFLIVVVLLINVFLGKADILINISNLGLLMLLGTKLLLSKYRIKRLK